ncbi:hypothetical protein GI482_04695 [Bacillus sp. N3536]|nr:hypothetical protein GI482_04695 [Bacillus sp. N3536]
MMKELKKLILDDFDCAKLSDYDTNRSFVSSYDLSLSKDYVKHGNHSLQINFNFGGWVTGNGAMYIKFKKELLTEQRPKKIAMWVHSDGKTPWLRATIIDGDNERKVVNLTDGNISWRGWKYLDAEIEQNWKLPLRLEQIYAVETNMIYQKDSSINGKFYLDQILFVYVDDQDLSGPVFSDILPEKEKVYSNSFVFSAVVSDFMSGVDLNSIIMKVNNELVIHSIQKNKISYHLQDLPEGNYTISVHAKDLAGNWSVPHLEKTYRVDLSQDLEKPILSNVTPTNSAVVYTATPRINFRLLDDQSGIEGKEIIITINNRQQQVIYDEETGWGYAIANVRLEDGNHHFSIYARDRAGNEMDLFQQEFFIQTLNSPKVEDCYSIAIIPDTHSLEYGKAALGHSMEASSDFVIHMGDFVDQGTEEEYILFKEFLLANAKKPILTLAGNHEAFQGNLKLYRNFMGSPAYHFNYGNVLFIILNSAIEQSITQSDSTQFTYLKEVLASNNEKRIVILTHVPTKDRFGTAHEMDRKDTKKLEEILIEYKRQVPSSDIVVLFGHLHTLDQWEYGGVRFIITGNSAPKGYVSKNQGNTIGYGLLHIRAEGLCYEYKPYS